MRVLFTGQAPQIGGSALGSSTFQGYLIRPQHGGGFGSFLSGLFRMALPFAQKGIKTLGKQALKTGLDITSDMLQGEDLKHSARRRGLEAGQALVTKARKQTGRGRGRKQRGRGIGKAKRNRTLQSINRRRTPRKRTVKQFIL